MLPNVDLVVKRLYEALAAVRTLVREVANVPLHVHLEATELRETLATLVTREHWQVFI